MSWIAVGTAAVSVATSAAAASKAKKANSSAANLQNADNNGAVDAANAAAKQANTRNLIEYGRIGQEAMRARNFRISEQARALAHVKRQGSAQRGVANLNASAYDMSASMQLIEESETDRDVADAMYQLGENNQMEEANLESQLKSMENQVTSMYQPLQVYGRQVSAKSANSDIDQQFWGQTLNTAVGAGMQAYSKMPTKAGADTTRANDTYGRQALGINNSTRVLSSGQTARKLGLL